LSDFLSKLLPTLVDPLPEDFNLFDVMHHGTHEKQLSNIFAWLLSVDGTHNLGDRFLRCFLDEVNLRLVAKGNDPVAYERFFVEQEQNTMSTRKGADIADIVLRGTGAVFVIENYYISDGHGHDYCAYMKYGESVAGGRSVVVMLCAIEDKSLLQGGWKRAPVITYANLFRRLFDVIDTDANYPIENPEQYGFLGQMKKHFLKGKQVNDDTSLEFIKVLCETGEARRYGYREGETSFAEFAESKALLNRVKQTLKAYLQSNLGRLNEKLDEYVFDSTNIGFVGIYQWDVRLKSQGKDTLFVLFGPSAWADNELDVYKSWDVKIDEPDYSCLFIGDPRRRRLIQSSVTMEEVLNGLAPEDTRLLDEIVSAVHQG
jgi:hypothetical protein